MAALIVFLAWLIPAAQQEIPRFKSGVDVVQFTVTVLDKERRPVTGLTAADFEVLVDGKPRPLAAFAAVSLPGESPAAAAAASIPPVAPDVQTNQLPAEGRLVVIIMDRSIRDEDMQAAHAIANAAIDRLGPNDLGAVVYTGMVSRKYSQGLTVDRERLHASANRTTFGAVHELPAMPSLSAAIASRGAHESIGEANGVPLASQDRSGECNCGLCVIDSLTALAKTLTGAMSRQKSVLFIGSDIPIASTVADQGGYCASYIYPARDKLTRALDEANVTFHVLDPHGLDPLEGPSFRMMSLMVLPDYTRGRTVLNNNKPEEKIGPIFDESRAYDVLAVARDPAASNAEDRHQIKITVTRSGAVVSARALYSAADPKADTKRAPNAAAAALAELLPRDDFSLQMNLVPQFSKDGSPEVRVLLGVDSRAAGKLDVLIRAYDRVFTPVGTPLKQRLDVPPGAVAGSSAFQWTSAFSLAPGDYEVRAAVAMADGTRAASVIGYTDVPDVKKEGLGLSGIVVKSGGTPTLRRTFAAGEPIALAFQVARAKTTPEEIAVSYRLTDDANGDLASGVFPRPATGTGAVEPYDFVLHMPDAAGHYVLTIEASAGRRVARRAVPVTVR